MTDVATGRYIVGLDLGTTNSAMAYIDTRDDARTIENFAVPQIVAPGVVESRETLPSFYYTPFEGEFAADALRLPWQRETAGYAVGVFARDHGGVSASRLVSSAKSWLCHPGVDRLADLLPWDAPPDVERISPVTTTSRYLKHYREAWDAAFPQEPLCQQEVVLTLPASFDEVARELTLKAAAHAGLPRVVLIEEPQAAFYAWIARHAADWGQRVQPGQSILVCDVGGGTTDFTLIRVKQTDAGVAQFHRVAVGQHLILGGDNFDLALAKFLEPRFAGKGGLPPRSFSQLVRACRSLKENLLTEGGPDRRTLTLTGTGSRLLGGSQQIEVTRDEVASFLCEGFFPACALDAEPAKSTSGFQEFGLPYAADAGITRYLAQFLVSHRWAGVAGPQVIPAGGHDPASPDIVLFNGGVFASPLFQQRVLASLTTWFGRAPLVLEHERLDLAVARGAAYYGRVRRGEGVRISAGLARTYYIGVEATPPRVVTIAPAGLEPGAEIDLSSRPMGVLVSQPIEFPLYSSSVRLTDAVGSELPFDRDQMTPLPPIRTVLKTRQASAGEMIPVVLKVRLTELGSLELSCAEREGSRTWRLMFDVRSATRSDLVGHTGLGERQGVLDDDLGRSACKRLRQVFSDRTDDPAPLMRQLADTLQLSRDDWPMSLLRQMWETLIDHEGGRLLSPQHASRWLNLVGFSLRPGYGFAVDDWRVTETWKLLQTKPSGGSAMLRTENWILWRRLSGGLPLGHQHALTSPLLAAARQAAKGGKHKSWALGETTHEGAEILRLLGSCERLAIEHKVELGERLLLALEHGRLGPLRAPAVWTVGRLGSRVPLGDSLQTVIPAEVAEGWSQRLRKAGGAIAVDQLALMQLSRATGDRYRDISAEEREHVVAWLDQEGAPPHYAALVQAPGELEQDEQGLVFGESLPRGLRLLR